MTRPTLSTPHTHARASLAVSVPSRARDGELVSAFGARPADPNETQW
mgnify:CR=1|jgi:hypothetical protein